jgi:hypothetical protein
MRRRTEIAAYVLFFVLADMFHVLWPVQFRCDSSVINRVEESILGSWFCLSYTVFISNQRDLFVHTYIYIYKPYISLLYQRLPMQLSDS